MNLDVIRERITAYQGQRKLLVGESHATNPHSREKRALRPAAVLIPIVMREGGSTILFTQRTDHLDHHPGQVSFPGGHVEGNDDTPEETALRETEEEVGLKRRHIDIVGRIDTYLTSTGFSVTPIIGLVRPPFSIKPDPNEVAEVFEVPLEYLIDSNNHECVKHNVEGVRTYRQSISYNGYLIWGVTAGMLQNFFEILNGSTITLECDNPTRRGE